MIRFLIFLKGLLFPKYFDLGNIITSIEDSKTREEVLLYEDMSIDKFLSVVDFSKGLLEVGAGTGRQTRRIPKDCNFASIDKKDYSTDSIKLKLTPRNIDSFKEYINHLYIYTDNFYCPWSNNVACWKKHFNSGGILFIKFPLLDRNPYYPNNTIKEFHSNIRKYCIEPFLSKFDFTYVSEGDGYIIQKI